MQFLDVRSYDADLVEVRVRSARAQELRASADDVESNLNNCVGFANAASGRLKTRVLVVLVAC
jgi:hypothetical protein